MVRKEFIIRILKTLDKEEYEQVLKNAKASGLNVNGFKDITKVPILGLIAVLNSNQNKKLDYLKCMAEAIIAQSEYALEKDKNNEQAKLRNKIAQFVIHKGNKKEASMEKLLEKLEHSVEQEKNKEEVMLTEGHQEQTISSEQYVMRISELEKLADGLTNEVSKIKEKNKKLEKKIMQLNMENETQEKLIKKQEKALKHAKVCQDREEAYKTLSKQFEQLQRDYSSLNERLKIRNTEFAELSEQLEYYKESNSRKVLCFTKKEIPKDNFSGLRIQNVKRFDVNDLIHWEDYDEVWVITKDFGYATVRDIERVSPKEVHTFYSHKMITTI